PRRRRRELRQLHPRVFERRALTEKPRNTKAPFRASCRSSPRRPVPAGRRGRRAWYGDARAGPHGRDVSPPPPTGWRHWVVAWGESMGVGGARGGGRARGRGGHRRDTLRTTPG